MLYQAIRKACEKYHPINGWDYDCALKAYREALKKRHESADSDNPSYEEAAILLSFANGWNANMTASFHEVRCALSEIEPNLEKLRGKTILDVCLDDETYRLIGRCFDRLAMGNTKKQHEDVGASKILHIIYPQLFVMWDRAIRSAYCWPEYAEHLRRMQRLAKSAVNQVQQERDVSREEDAIAYLSGCKHSLAKALDEYNFMKYTKEAGSVWQAEYESCNSP